ncbi:EMYY motif lipoprotein [Macrococcus equipercicus]|uniref:EMYY motif lipoprotein n=1 Tax=Macrococcus equipercicus TaxID=69967 RepID=A0A9Q9BRE9_9STAP|nr:EMYY motif lipoprotein [Macrococcus equipercicus]KAA1042440.1 EMYY motif lipoprotein [Macrococcus equipercicus]UTH14326.1 EMYY motif lipoprotein [Macrococcus equipercicus]
MKIIIRLFVLLCLTMLAACGNELKSDINDYKAQMTDVQSEEKKLVKSIDRLKLEKADQLIGSEVTEAKKEKLKAIELALNNKVMPQLAVYEKKLDAVEVKTTEVADVHEIYVDNFKKKKQFINDMYQYISLYNQSIVSNEEILGYTKVFEKNKEKSEQFAARAVKNKKEQADYNALTDVINANNAELKTKVGYLIGSAGTKEKQNFIAKTLLPLLHSHVEKLNKTNISSADVIQMRTAQTEIDYSLINYYKERKHAMGIEKSLQHMPIQSILENTKQIKSIDDKYYEALKKLEEKA